MPEAKVALREGERTLKESADNHLLRSSKGRDSGLCHPVLTDRRIVFLEACHDFARAGEGSVGGALWDVPLEYVARVGAGPDRDEPSLRLEVAAPGQAPESALLYFRDPGWLSGSPRRAQERDAWVAAVSQALPRLGEAESAPSPAAPRQTAPVPQDARGEVQAGSVLGGKYKVLRRIGLGGMAVVYEGRDLSLDRPVAVKQMRPDAHRLRQDRSRFLKEARIAAALHHPFIVDIYDILETPDDVFLVFEFVDGETIFEYLERRGRMKLPEARKVLRCSCEALDYAHSQKVVHRDLKTSNIMLTRQGYAKVMDFGIARQAKDTAMRQSTLDSSGTAPFMAPEQEMGKSDIRSDVFALGATVYEMLSGEIPFKGPNFYVQKEKEAYDPLSELVPDLPAEVREAVDRCLRFDPGQRFQTVAEFARAVGAL